MAPALMAAATTSCSPRRAAPLLKPVASSSSSSSSARPRRPLPQQLPRLLATAAAAVAAAPLPALAEQMEKAALFDFNLTLPAIATEFLLLMVALDKLYFTPLGKFMDERDAKIRGELGDVKDASEEVKQLEEQAAAIMKAARAEIAAALNKMKKETTAELEAKLDEGRKRVEAELVEALANLEAQKEEAVKALDAQIASLSADIVKKAKGKLLFFGSITQPFSTTNKDQDILEPLMIDAYLAKGLSKLTTDEKLQGAFAPFGRLLDTKVVTDKVSGRSKGFGFVRYATIEEAERARQEMNAKFLDGWVIFVDPAKPRQPKPAPQQDTRSTHAGFTTNKTVGWCG